MLVDWNVTSAVLRRVNEVVMHRYWVHIQRPHIGHSPHFDLWRGASHIPCCDGDAREGPKIAARGTPADVGAPE
jgi:hypothetical protein